MKISRKELLNSSAIGLFGFLTLPELFAKSAHEGTAVVVHADEGETYWIGIRNSPLTIKIAKDKMGNETMSFCRELIAPGEGIPVHKHLNEDELIFVHRGEGTLTIDDREILVKEGSVALVPKGVWHAMFNSGKEALSMVFSYAPAGFEGYFREMGSPAGTPWQPKTKEFYNQLNEKWGIVYK